ncbi:MAG: hypothetical protein J0M17_08275 [Planctomycetes bacterium]|nr:hypothetical protein [Planctomycetota bacterium]
MKRKKSGRAKIRALKLSAAVSGNGRRNGPLRHRRARKEASPLGWLFPQNLLGQDFGIHDAGVETFRGDYYRYLAREIIQNSLDARNSNKPARVKFDTVLLNRSAIPGIKELTETFERCAEYWSGEADAQEFFENAIAVATAPRIAAMRISDFNTTGVVGEDDDRKKDKNWYSLIRCSGSSSKNHGEGGSYGIGKNAPFAASQLRTVLYSTNTGQGKVAFQGVARLATHEAPTVGKAHHIGYLGGPEGQSIRDASDIPELFRRKERGTDVIILGSVPDKTWSDQLRHSVLENFWPAIHFGYLEVEIGDLQISADNLSDLLESSAKEPGFVAHHYYASFVAPTKKFSTTLPNLREVSVCLKSGQQDLPKRVAMVRKSGMVIYHKRFNPVVHFCGVFLCESAKGNERLRKMEPPKHDKWDPDLPQKGVNKSTEHEFVGYIRDCIRELADKDDSKVIAIPELSHFLPDDGDTDEPGGAEESHEDKVEGFTAKKPSPKNRQAVPISKMSKRKPAIFDARDDDDDDDEDALDGNGKRGVERRSSSSAIRLRCLLSTAPSPETSSESSTRLHCARNASRKPSAYSASKWSETTLASRCA